MNVVPIAHLRQASVAAALPGTWKLAHGRAITLRPATDGVLRVAHGRIWATLDGPHGVTPQDSGDHVLAVGSALRMHAGQQVVLEAWGRSGAAYFSWDPALALADAARRQRWVDVRQPLADLRSSAALALQASARLFQGLGRLAWSLLPARFAAARPSQCSQSASC